MGMSTRDEIQTERVVVKTGITGRRVAAVTGALGLAAVGLLLFVYWEDVQAEYHFHRLRGSPDHVLSIVEEPEGTPERRAIVRYLEDPEGQRGFLKVFVDTAYEEAGERPHPPGSHNVYAVTLGLTDHPQTGRHVSLRIHSHNGASNLVRSVSKPCDGSPLIALHNLLGRLDEDSERILPGYPGLRFRLSRPSGCASGDRAGGLVVASPEREVLVRILSQLDGLEAIRALVVVGPGAVSHLVLLLDDTEAKVRFEAAYALQGLAPSLRSERNEAISALLELLRDEDLSVRRAAGRALVALVTSDARLALTPLIEALEDTDAVVRARAAAALGNHGRGDREVVEALIRALGDADGHVRFRAAQSLGDIGARAVTAVPALQEALKDKHGLVAHHAKLALERIGGVR